MTKHIYHILILLLCGGIMLSSCKNEEEDLFDKSASERMESEVVKYRDLLVKAPHGWIMEYYPGGTSQTFGGYTLTVKFSKEGNVVFQSSASKDVSTSAISLYSIKKDEGATLNFDTYNEIFHSFSTPDIAYNGEGVGAGLGKGLMGDYEFILKSSTDTEIVLKGKKHGSQIYMYTLQEPANSYLAKVKKIRDSYIKIVGVEQIKGTFAGKPVIGVPINQQYIMLTQDEEQTKFAFIFTDKGVKLYSPITLNGKTVDKLEWNAKKKSFTSPDGNTKLELVADPLGLNLERLIGDYTLTCLSNGNKKLEVDASIIQNRFGMVSLQGLPFNISLKYNVKKGGLEILPQDIRYGVSLAVWQVVSPGYFVRTGTNGLITKWNGSDTDFQIAFKDNGVEWFAGGSRIYARGFILWTDNGEYKELGVSRFIDITLKKK